MPLCALAAHAVAYRSFLPSDPAHGYLGSYEAVVAFASTLALGAVLLSALFAALGRRDGLVRVLAPRADSAPPGYRVASIALWAYGLLVVQETAEAIVGATRGESLSFGFGSWLVAVAALVATATIIVLLERSYRRVVGALAAVRVAAPHTASSVRRPSRPIYPARRNALADFRALRAPPIFA